MALSVRMQSAIFLSERRITGFEKDMQLSAAAMAPSAE